MAGITVTRRGFGSSHEQGKANPGKVFYATSYGVAANGKTVTDAQITSGQATLSSTSAGFTTADRGKLIVVIGAGAAGAHLYTTISSVSGGIATLATTAGTTVSGAECFYASNDTAAVQACVNAAAAAGGTALLPEGDIGISSPIVAPASSAMAIQGSTPPRELFGGTTQYNDANFPTIPPYLKGSVLVQCSPNVDAIQLNAQGVTHHAKWLGIRFAGRYLNTGHGMVSSPTSGKLGNIGGLLEDIRVFGHDGNHYGHVIDSPELMRWVGLRSYGGGGIWLKTNASVPGPPGNITSLDTYSMTVLAGTAHGFFIDCSALATSYFDYCVFVNAEHIVSSPSPALTGTSPPTSAQSCLKTTYGASQPTMQTIGFVNPCMESTVNSTSTFPAGPGCYRTNDPVSALGNATMTTAPTSGTGYQNLLGKPETVLQEFMLQPAAAATASTTTTAIVGSGSTSIPVTSSTGFTVGQGIQIDTGANLEFAIVATVPDGTHITVTTPGNYGLEINHASGVTVAAGSAVLYAQTSSNGTFPSPFRWARFGIAIGASPQHISFNFPVPSGWYYRMDWANCARMWTDYVGSFG